MDKDRIKLKEIFIITASGVLFFTGLVPALPLWLKATLFASSYCLAGWDVVLKAFKNIVRGQLFDEYFLMSLATLGAFLIGEFPEAAAVMLFYKAGQMLQGIAVNNSRRSIKALVDLRPDHVNLKTSAGLRQVDPNAVAVGDIILIKPGERIPLDAIVTEGISHVDTSALTGESMPRTVKAGDTVLSGFVNQSGVLSAAVTKSLSQSTVSRILDLVQNAASKKAPAENFITKFARYYTPLVAAGALLIAVVPPILSGSLVFAPWIYRALVFLVISCPCALVISVPLSFFGGIGGASRRGILIKGSNYLEALNSVDTVVFDKTGTLTKGVFKVTEIIGSNGYSNAELLEIAALAETHSSHPAARSIIEAYKGSVDESRVQSCLELPGYGIKAVVDGKEILVGNDRLLHTGDCIEHDKCLVQGTVVHVAIDGTYAGYILISDEIREDAPSAVSRLREQGISRIVMLTGDCRQSADSIAGLLKLDEVYSGLLPHQKVEVLENLEKSSSGKLAFVGDGINDAPVIARADVGIAMGALGSDAAIEASDIVLMTDEPSKLADAIAIARKTRAIVIQNIVFALGVKLLVLILGAGGIATMWEAVFADVGVTLLAVFNALRVVKKA
ncbi:MAG: heavy metal translocating P-type ATPase [Thermoleophilia bacterium]